MKRLGTVFNKKNSLVLVLGILVLIGMIIFILRFRITAETTAPVCKNLISYDRDGGGTPTYFANNINRIESSSNFPYNGVTIHLPSSVMSSTAVSVDTYRSNLKPLKDMTTKPKKLTHNMVRVLLGDPGDLFNDTAWNTTAQNFANLSIAIKELDDSDFGIDGILFDNEGPYTRPSCSTGDKTHGLWNLPVTSSEITEYNSHSDCWPYIRSWETHDAAAYKAKAQERGYQIINKIVTSQAYPNMKFMFMHSTDTSCANMDDLGIRQNDVAYANEMLGPFTIGLAEAARGTSVKIIDGGEESYGYVTADKFANSYNLRNSGMATTYQSYCPFIPSADKPIWSELFDTGFGLYNKVHGVGGGQTPTTISQAVKNALTQSDNYVWFYTEDVSSIDPQKSNYIDTTGNWMSGIIQGRNAVLNDTDCDSITPPPTTSSELSDLAITGVHMIPSNPANGDEVLFTVDVTNQGTGATQTGTGIFLGAAFKIDGAWATWSDNITTALAPGQSITLTPNYGSGGKNTWTATTGNHTFETVLDNMGKITESNENNNLDQRTITVPSVCATPATPETFTATQNSSNPTTSINLAWSDSTTDHDGFKLSRSLNSTSGFELLPVTLGVDSRTYTDSNLTSNTTYYYRLTSYKGSCESNPKTANAQTGSQPTGVLTVTHTPTSPGSRTIVTIRATLSGITSAQSISIYVDGNPKKTCSNTTSCSYDSKYPRGTHSYYATSTAPNLRDPITGSKSFKVVWWKL